MMSGKSIQTSDADTTADVEYIAAALYRAANPTMEWSWLFPAHNHLHAAVRQRYIDAAARFQDDVAQRKEQREPDEGREDAGSTPAVYPPLLPVLFAELGDPDYKLPRWTQGADPWSYWSRESISSAVESAEVKLQATSYALADNQCIVALDEGGTGWIIARSDKIRETDLLMECDAENNGFNSGWDSGLSVGAYLVTLKGWSHRDSMTDHVDCGVDVVECKPLWTIPGMNYRLEAEA